MKTLISGTFLLFLTACQPEKSILQSRQFLREYAFDRCLYFAINDSFYTKVDASYPIYLDISRYPETVFVEIDSMSKKWGEEIKAPPNPDFENRKPVVLGCFVFYNNSKLQEFIKSKDKDIVR